MNLYARFCTFLIYFTSLLDAAPIPEKNTPVQALPLKNLISVEFSYQRAQNSTKHCEYLLHFSCNVVKNSKQSTDVLLQSLTRAQVQVRVPDLD